MSKSSPYAVSTERDTVLSADLDAIKKYLYVETDIESDFKKLLTGLSSTDKKVIFLCGSSGDGKSEILTKYNKDYGNRADFHLDATHSFRPSDSAIETLDELFTDFESTAKPLVVGINIGMLGNYAQEGAVTEVTASIKAFLEKQPTPDNHIYLDFEDYPKFALEIDGHTSKFVKDLLQKITAKDENLIRQHFDVEMQKQSQDKKLCANYQLLEREEVQDVIIDLLFKARLMKDQFLTARALLDFIFHLLAGPGYLFDNLFKKGDNELTNIISDFDPSIKRTQKIDKFILSHSLQLPDTDFEDYKTALSDFGIRRGQSAESYIRLFYLLRKSEYGNEYHKWFVGDFDEHLIDNYSEVWHLHTSFDNSPEQKEKLRHFYRQTAITAIHKYNNRNAPKLAKGEFFISEHNGYFLASSLELKADVKAIKNSTENNTSFFTANFRVGDKTLSLMVNINLLNLMQRIVSGYRPNKHDKNTVVLLDELVDEIADIANSADTLYIVGKGQQQYKVTNVDNEDFEVSGL
ncbi:DNA phosphorothioation-dependent restriction protein DptF [Vibrio sp. DW001]|uniref:DNA phosphorothioation-dependent restriction protein DptF n=1 Tax=Vibrio sp. DW001 TaxID=2912315 RepID=UPI0023B1028B|nr:DNA phosphorothioation-dependent restriction protein DptF [Vibrio sp. DW001]WED25453.1 DNA phosphorothioation-dependent restriction protein DptF [Vibrio sp. DW001]